MEHSSADSHRAISICSGNVDVEVDNNFGGKLLAFTECSIKSHAMRNCLHCGTSCVTSNKQSYSFGAEQHFYSQTSVSSSSNALFSLYYIITIADALGWINTVRYNRMFCLDLNLG
ncbi:conserved hypothetical protein [Trichinella spiralis]|uniref:hypothetical protein n=1 Tax=Trichinella spiralis TaxID=6334 RepID=UPI0001EFC453|nr:conserved hypothetical protein [Trichinella spiralis]